MNFQDLLAKMKQLDETPMGGAGAGDECVEPGKVPGEGEYLAGESNVEECGMDMMPHASAPKQSDSVTMNVSMNGSGAGGIADLMKILRNIESGEHGHADADDVLVGMNAEEGFEDATTRPDPQTAGVDAVTPTGDDLASKDGEALKVNGGGNPMAESLAAKLAAMYENIKGAPMEGVGAMASAMGTPTQAPAPTPIPGKTGSMDPVRNNPVNPQTQNVSPQANRPGLAPNGDPKLWDIQHELAKKGFKIKADGLNGPATEQAARQAGLIHDVRQDVANPNAASFGQQVGHAIGSATGWIETAWRNLKQGFSQGQQGMEESSELDDIRKLSGLKSEAYNPNSASAENRRNLDKHEHDRLKAAAEKEGATDADKARYKRYQDRKAATRAAYDAEMER